MRRLNSLFWLASILLAIGIVGCNRAQPDQKVTEDAAASDQSLGRRGQVAENSSMPMPSSPMAVAQALSETAEGIGPGMGGDQYATIVESIFHRATDEPLSTFSIDVDTASYANTRRFLLQNGALPPAGAVRIEELVNYFSYSYDPPKDDVPFATHVEVAACPWKPEHRLVRIGLKGKVVDSQERPASNLVFLLDVSGSMQGADKIELMKKGMTRLVDELGENDRVAIVVYASASGLVLPSTSADQKDLIRESLQRLRAGGSTNGGDGIRLAYQVARDNFITGGTNRVILATDGDFNVGTSSQDELVRLVEKEAASGVQLSVLGFGRGNLNDSMMEEVSNRGDGNYAYIDGLREAEKVLVEQVGGTLLTIAKDVKIQVEFNPAQVSSYRLIGYENRKLQNEDFNNDEKDAGEIGAGHTVTALYQVVPAATETTPVSVEESSVDPLEFQGERPLTAAAASGQLLTLKLRYKDPDQDESKLLKFAVNDTGQRFGKASQDFKFASAAAGFGLLLRDSKHKGNLTYDALKEIAEANMGEDTEGYRRQFVELVDRARSLTE